MKFKIHVVIDDNDGQTQIEEVIRLEKGIETNTTVGLSLAESKQLLKKLQAIVVLHQAQAYTTAHRCCPHCHKARRVKGYTTIQYRTLFGAITLPNQRVYHCPCSAHKAKTKCLLSDWLPEQNCPELQYIETKWASLIPMG